MAATGISQMPVDSGQGDLRMIEELDILRAVASNEHGLEDSVRDIARPLEGRISSRDNLSHVQQIFEQNNVAVVVDEGRVLGIINKIDLLEFINNHNRQAA
jgi:predicted transcriptional regulator